MAGNRPQARHGPRDRQGRLEPFFLKACIADEGPYLSPDGSRYRTSARQDEEGLASARRDVNSAKVGLGERGPVWWTDGAEDFNRHLVKNTPYAEWFASTQGVSD